MAEECVFCKIINKELPAAIVYEDDDILAFKDIKPIAPVHILIIPKKHIPDMTAVTENDVDLIGKIHLAAIKIAEEQGISEKGFRLVNNCKQHGGQVVYHLHYHLLGGEALSIFA